MIPLFSTLSTFYCPIS